MGLGGRGLEGGKEGGRGRDRELEVESDSQGEKREKYILSR